MMTAIDDDDRVVWMPVPMSPKTAERLLNLANECHAAPDKVAATLLHDVLKDDELAHQDQNVPEGTTIN